MNVPVDFSDAVAPSALSLPGIATFETTGTSSFKVLLGGQNSEVAADGSDKKTKHLLPNGFYKFLVNNVKELELLMMLLHKLFSSILTEIQNVKKLFQNFLTRDYGL